MREFHAAVHHLRTPDPVVAAQRVQHEIGGDLAADADTAETLVRSRVEAGRRALGGDPAADAALLARRDEILAAAAAPPAVDEAGVAELRRLGDDLERAARIRERTEARVAETLLARVAASTGVVLHPSAVRDTAAAVIEAEHTLRAANEALAALGPDPGEDTGAVASPAPGEVEPATAEDDASGSPDPVLKRPHDVFDERRLEVRRSRWRAAAILVLFVLGAVILVGFDASPRVAVAVGVLGVALAALEVARGRRAGRRVAAADHGPYEHASHLAAVASAVADTTSGRKAAALTGPPADDGRDSWLARRAAVDAERDEAEERLRVVQNRWRQLTGPTADPHDVETIIRAHDPQLAYTDQAVGTSPTVRTVAAFHRKAQARWKVVWASLGREHAPAPGELDGVLEELLGEHREAIAEAGRVAEAEARVAALAAVHRPLVLAEPSLWLAPNQLDQLLASVPPEGLVILVERSDADGPAAAAGPEDAVELA